MLGIVNNVWINRGVHISILFLRFYLFLERGKGGRKRWREISVCGCLSCTTYWPTTQACALTGNGTGDPLVHRLALNPLSDTSQGHMSIWVGVFFFSLNKYPEVELLDHKTVLLLIFWGTSMQFSIVAVPIYNLTNSAQRFPFLHTVTNTCYLAFLTIAILICVIILHCLTESSGNAIKILMPRPTSRAYG